MKFDSNLLTVICVQVTVPLRCILLEVWVILVVVMLYQNMFWIWSWTLSEVLSALESQKSSNNTLHHRPHTKSVLWLSKVAQPGLGNEGFGYLHLPFCWQCLPFGSLPGENFTHLLPKGRESHRNNVFNLLLAHVTDSSYNLLQGALGFTICGTLSCEQNAL